MASVYPTRNFLFLSCEGSTGRASASMRFRKNRHAQLGVSYENDAGIEPSTAPPVQIRFRAAEGLLSEREEAVLLTRGTPATRVLRRCYRCRKRRMITYSTGRCAECDRLPNRTLRDIAGKMLPFACEGPDEAKAMHYFYNFAALDLSGYLPGRFWDRLVLQSSQSESVVRQAVVAVGSAHLDHCTSVVVSPKTMALHQAALGKLRAYMGQQADPSRELVLLCCILFFTFDRLVCDAEAAAVHLKSAMSILNSTQCARYGNGAVGRETLHVGEDTIQELSVWLMQMDIETTMQDLDCGPRLHLDHDVLSAMYSHPSVSPTMKFATPHEAHEPWMRICHDLWRFVGANSCYRHLTLADVPVAAIEERTRIKMVMKIWWRAFEEYQLRHPPPDVATIAANPDEPLLRALLDALNALIIESHYYVVKSILAESLGDEQGERPFDKDAEKLLQVGERALRLRQAYKDKRALHIHRNFSTHVGIVESILLFAHRTTKPSVRARAQYLIRAFRDVQDGLTGITPFFSGYGAPPADLILIYEPPGH